MAKLNSLHDLFIDQTKDLLGAEKLLSKALGKMVKKADSQDLRQALSEHKDVTDRQIERLEQIQRDLGISVKSKRCPAMEGLVQEGQEIMDMEGDPIVLDAGIIAASQKIEHYEIASYGTLRTYAETLGYQDVARLLEETLNEEKETDKRLTSLAESHINQEAMHQLGMEGGTMGRSGFTSGSSGIGGMKGGRSSSRVNRGTGGVSTGGQFGTVGRTSTSGRGRAVGRTPKRGGR